MFELTRREQMMVAGFLAIFLLGFGVMHWRDSVASAPQASASAAR